MKPFELERYFAAHEFNTRHLLSPSDCESLSLGELLAMADPECRRLWEELRLGYTESPGHPLLRAEVARQYRTIPAGAVLIAAPEEAIYIAMHAGLRPGDHVVCLTPAYQSLHEVARSLGCRVSAWPLLAGDTGWRLDLDGLERLVTPETRLLVINFPHNPSGFQPTAAEQRTVLDIAARNGTRVFSDEMYRFLEYDPADRLEPSCDLYEKAVSLSGLSKAWGAPGLRLGWLAGRDREWLDGALAMKDYTTICNSAPGEILGLIALRAGDAILDRSRAIIRANRERAAACFANHPDRLRWLPPQGGPVAFPRLAGDEDADDFCRRSIAECGTMIVPGSMFGWPGPHFRIGLGRRDFTEALRQIEPLLGKP